MSTLRPIKTGFDPHQKFDEGVELLRIDDRCFEIIQELKTLTKANFFSLNAFEGAFRSRNFKQFRQGMEGPLQLEEGGGQIVSSLLKFLYVNLPAHERVCEDDVVESCPVEWKRYLTQCVDKKEVPVLLEFLKVSVPKWKKSSKGHRVYAPRCGQIRYSFELDRDGAVWIYHTRLYLAEVQSLVTNLQTGETCQTVSFSPEMRDKILGFYFLFKNTDGIIRFFERFEIRRALLVKHELYDCSLEVEKLPLSFPDQLKVAQQLVSGLMVLEKERIVHCGIYPSSIYLQMRWSGKDEMTAVLANFQDAHKEVPEKLHVPSKWSEYMPPEEDLRKYPFAIPIYQLGQCFKKLFRGPSHDAIGSLIEGMTKKNPGERWGLDDILLVLGIEADDVRCRILPVTTEQEGSMSYLNLSPMSDEGMDSLEIRSLPVA